MHAYLDEPTQERIIKAVRGALAHDPEVASDFGPIMRKRFADFAVLSAGMR